MDFPIEIVSRNLTLPESETALIRKRAAGFSHFFERILRCRITVEGPGIHHRQGRHKVKIALAVSGRQIVVDHQQGEDLAEALKEAFDAATRRLEDHARVRRGSVKAHKA